MKVIWSATARFDLLAIGGWIERPRVRTRVLRRIRRRVALLRDFPLSGRVVPEFDDPALREAIVEQYRIIHLVTPTRIEILTVLDGRRPLMPPFTISEATLEYEYVASMEGIACLP